MPLHSQYLGRAITQMTGGITAAPSPIAITAVLRAGDFCFYVIHRFHRASPLFWPFHAVPHFAEQLSPISAYRFIRSTL